ncbi:hypothetical protein ILYODFUR_032162 [Ilyodon furcidens]|uniref:Uncharacterized protein n=1 Tax=Ilyodon furcidens TaxID=33524 RepID=A0ABV0UMM2_9TELE
MSYCVCVWSISCTVPQRKALQRVINAAQKIVGSPLPNNFTVPTVFEKPRRLIYKILHTIYSRSLYKPKRRTAASGFPFLKHSCISVFAYKVLPHVLPSIRPHSTINGQCKAHLG